MNPVLVYLLFRQLSREAAMAFATPARYRLSQLIVAALKWSVTQAFASACFRVSLEPPPWTRFLIAAMPEFQQAKFDVLDVVEERQGTGKAGIFYYCTTISAPSFIVSSNKRKHVSNSEIVKGLARRWVQG
ncbi:hypothetical protein ACQRIT_000750 [Beauveria bassiana]